jgi:hypothetical protein
MYLDPSTFDYHKATEAQIEQMAVVRKAFHELAKQITAHVPAGHDQQHAIRLIRAASMWCNACITRHEDGTPRT